MQLLGWATDWVSNIAGEISFVLLMAMWVTSFAYTRRRNFELFFYTHQLYTVATFFYIMHIGVPWLCQILPGMFLFTIDRYLRFLQSRSRARLLSARLLPCETVEMTFSKSPGEQTINSCMGDHELLISCVILFMSSFSLVC